LARIIKEYAVRRSEILDAAQGLIYTRGYEQMTIQDILDVLHISKGAFYHYFVSKPDLLEALIERMVEDARRLLVDQLAADSLPALEKLERCFAAANRWKLDQRDYLLALMQVWYHDDNAIVRLKAQESSTKMFAPFLAEIIQEGISQGVIQTHFPDQAAGVILSLLVGIGDAVSQLLLSGLPETEIMSRLQQLAGAYMEAIERTLQIAPGSLHLVDAESLKVWINGREG
jgi:AcrR family transcriptional regulator